jgi:hypothetical protein
MVTSFLALRASLLTFAGVSFWGQTFARPSSPVTFREAFHRPNPPSIWWQQGNILALQFIIPEARPGLEPARNLIANPKISP